ncbi:MAG: EamA family transporter [Candidatus Pacebacteria bacterium]|nr:EamA family transporter [Candidatus Paceibacterota bacterium]
MKQKSIGYLEIIIAVSIWAISSGVIVRWIDQGAEIIYGVGAMAGFVFVLIWLVSKKQTKKISESYSCWKELVLIGLFIGLNNGLFFMAMKTTTIANAILTHYFEPILLVLIFAPLILKQKIKRKHIFASSIGFAGLLVVLGSQLNSAALNFGVLLGLMSAVFFAWYTVIESKLATTTKIDPIVEVLYKNGVPALMFAPFVISKFASGGIGPDDFCKLVFFGVLVLGISFVLLFRGLAKVSSQNASVIFYGEPIGAIILAWMIWGEQLSLGVIAGGALILAAGCLAVRDK